MCAIIYGKYKKKKISLSKLSYGCIILWDQYYGISFIHKIYMKQIAKCKCTLYSNLYHLLKIFRLSTGTLSRLILSDDSLRMEVNDLRALEVDTAVYQNCLCFSFLFFFFFLLFYLEKVGMLVTTFLYS